MGLEEVELTEDYLYVQDKLREGERNQHIDSHNILGVILQYLNSLYIYLCSVSGVILWTESVGLRLHNEFGHEQFHGRRDAVLLARALEAFRHPEDPPAVILLGVVLLFTLVDQSHHLLRQNLTWRRHILLLTGCLGTILMF